MGNNSILRKLVVIVGCVTLMSGLSAEVSYADTATSNANGKVLVPIGIAATAQELSFGTFAATNATGTIVVTSAGVRTPTGVKALGGTPSAARFNITGEPDLAFNITLPANDTVKLKKGGTSGADDMALTTFTADLATTGALLNSSGAATLNVGATVTVAPNQAAGDYSTAFDVSVDYQ